MTTVHDHRTRRDITGILADHGQDPHTLADPDQWQTMLAVQARFPRYSPQNRLLIWSQRPDATRIHGPHRWQTQGRRVRPDAEPILLMGPDGGWVKTFDVTQTYGIPLRTRRPPRNRLLARLITASIDTRHVHGVIFAADDTGHHGARSWWSPTWQEITLVDDTEPRMTQAFLHELGHAHDPGYDVDLDRARREVVADSAARVLGLPLGVDTDGGVFGYVAAGWQDAGSLVWLAERVAATADSARAVWETLDNTLVYH